MDKINDSLDPKKWLRFAHDDIYMAEMGAKRFRPPIEAVCCHCQQAAEKVFKAYILAQGGTHKKTHIFKDILKECKNYSQDFDSLQVACARLAPYVTLGRYPADIEPTEYHMREALKDAGQILDFTKSKLKELGHEYLPEENNKE